MVARVARKIGSAQALRLSEPQTLHVNEWRIQYRIFAFDFRRNTRNESRRVRRVGLIGKHVDTPIGKSDGTPIADDAKNP